jgi:5'-3' exonuclease
MATVLLIDLSSIAYPIWHMSQSEPDVNATSTATVAKVRALASGQPHVAVCCDSGRSFRAEIDPTYKANRGERDATLIHQIDLARERLIGDGFPVWAQPGMEADDLIATATGQAVAAGHEVLVVSADKDLLQLVAPTVRVKSLASGTEYDEAAVEAKLGVKPSQVRDYLTLVGDAADNVKGADKIGAKTAAVLLWTHGTIEGIYEEAAKEPCALKPSVVASLKEFAPRFPTVRALISLRYDADIPFEDILKDRVPAEAETFMEEEMETVEAEPVPEAAPATETKPEAPTALAVRTPEALAPAEFERQLEPRSMDDAKSLSKMLFDSRMFSAYGTPQAVLSTVLAGRELGLPAMVSLRAFHVIEGKATLSAEAIRARVLTSGKAKFFRRTERTATRATFETQRGDDPPVSLTYTIEEAKAAWTRGDAKWAASAWGTAPADMLIARCSSKLAREVYPDVTLGLYASEEFDQ